MKINEIEKQLKATQVEELPNAWQPFLEDNREGVKKILIKYQKKYEKHQEAIKAWEIRQMFDEVLSEGSIVVGIDEVGRGPLAGPVVAAAVILPPHASLIGLRDSKKLSEKKREELYDLIKEQAVSIGIGIVEAWRIDEINILQATFEGMRQALQQLTCPYDCILVDGDKKIPGIEGCQQAIISGDDKSAAIGAASIIAKVTRDRLMREYAALYPGYEWESNKGYGSLRHYEGIRTQGLTPLHRRSFLKNEGIV